MFIQLQSFLSANHIFETFQSGFKPLHSTESALLRVLNYTLLATDSGDSVILILLDLTSAFDTVDHKTLLSRLEYFVGIQGTVLSWFKSYLTNRSFSVRLGNFSSLPAKLSCGVPQGSILFFLCIYFLWALSNLNRSKQSMQMQYRNQPIYPNFSSPDLISITVSFKCIGANPISLTVLPIPSHYHIDKGTFGNLGPCTMVRKCIKTKG